VLTRAQEGAFLACDAKMAARRAAGGQRPFHGIEAVDLVLGLHDVGEAPDPDAVRAWFAAAGWDDADARGLARIAVTVGRVLGEHDRAADAVPAPSVVVAADEGPVELDTITTCAAMMARARHTIGGTCILLDRSRHVRQRSRSAAYRVAALLGRETTRTS
jgi:hypothetical protein